MGQSILRDWKTPFRIEYYKLLCEYTQILSKGNHVNIRGPGHGDWLLLLALVKRGNANKLGDVNESPGKSSLFLLRNGLPGIGSAGDRDVVSAKRHGSCGVRCTFVGP